MALSWSNEVIADLLTRQRLGSYLSASGGDIDAAIALYDWNIEASGALLSLVSMVEVVARNALDAQLSAWSQRTRGTSEWFDHVPLDQRGRRDVIEARGRAVRRQPSEVHGKVVAELSLGFWRYLAASRYLTSLWVPALHGAFPHGASDARQRRGEVERRLQRLAFVRNRAAHHEPIHQRLLVSDVADAVTLAGWVSRDAAEWVRARESVSSVYARRPS